MCTSCQNINITVLLHIQGYLNYIFLRLESHILSGFGVINFKCPKNLQDIAENVCSFSFQRKAFTILTGGGTKETVCDSKWKEISQNYGRWFFQKDELFVEAVLIPNFTKNAQPCEVLWNGVINLETIRQWCSTSYSPLG